MTNRTACEENEIFWPNQSCDRLIPVGWWLADSLAKLLHRSANRVVSAAFGDACKPREACASGHVGSDCSVLPNSCNRNRGWNDGAVEQAHSIQSAPTSADNCARSQFASVRFASIFDFLEFVAWWLSLETAKPKRPNCFRTCPTWTAIHSAFWTHAYLKIDPWAVVVACRVWSPSDGRSVRFWAPRVCWRLFSYFSSKGKFLGAVFIDFLWACKAGASK